MTVPFNLVMGSFST